MSKFDPKKYAGTWHELARTPNVFQSDVWWIPRDTVSSIQRITPEAEIQGYSVINEMCYKWNLPCCKFLFGEKNVMLGNAWFDGKSSFKMIFDGLLGSMVLILHMLFMANKRIIAPEAPNYHIKKIIENQRGEYEYVLMTGGQAGEENWAWIMTKRHPDTMQEKHFNVVKDLLAYADELGYDASSMKLHPLLEKRDV